MADERLVYWLVRAQHRVSTWLLARAGGEGGVSVAQAGVLFALEAEDGMTSSGLARELGVAPAAMTGLSKRMERAGLVERRKDTRDRRVMRVFITDQGREMTTRAADVLGELNAELRAEFTEDELAVVQRWLEHATNRLSSPEGDGGT